MTEGEALIKLMEIAAKDKEDGKFIDTEELLFKLKAHIKTLENEQNDNSRAG